MRQLLPMPFNKQSAKQAAADSHAATARKRYPSTRNQALDLQRGLHLASVALTEDLPECRAKDERARVASALASVAKGWQSITDALRIQDGVPLPGSLRPEKPAKDAKRKSAVVLESEPESKPPAE